MDFSYDDFMECFFSDNTAAIAGSTSTAAATSLREENGCSLTDWSLDIDWDCDYRDLIESMAGDDEGAMLVSPPTLPTQRVADVEEPTTTPDDVSKGLRLVHLLLAAAESSTGGNKTRELTRVILQRLKDLVSPHSDHQTNMERLAALFTNGLSKLLESGPPHQHLDDVHADVYVAFQLLQNMSPYVNFGYLTATQAIIEAVNDERRIHIVDYDIGEGFQWASLIQALASKNTGLSKHHLRITAVSRPITNGKKSVVAVQEAGRRLTAFAESIGQPFSFHHYKQHTDTFTPSSLHLIRGEALVVNCMLHLPRFTHQTLLPNSLVSFLSEARRLNPKLVTLIHEEIGMTGNRGFTYRFMDLLHQFSAMLDSLEASPFRGFVERVCVAPWVSSWLARITASAHDDAGAESFATWPQWLESNGFAPVEVSFANRCQAKLLLSLFSDGHVVEELGQNGLVLGWKSRRLASASFWAYRE